MKNSKIKNIQIPENLFVDFYKLLLMLEKESVSIDTINLVNSLKTQMNSKLDAIQKRKTYTEYKTAATDTEKEKARHEYLDIAQIPNDWRF